jgi:POT family proton-dependent oligopeptide transporter
LPIYTALFNKLGIAALVCTLIAIAVLPLMKRLSQTHHAASQPV